MTTGSDSGATDPQGAADSNTPKTPAGRPLAGGRYDLGEVVGTGGMAEVRLGTDRRLGRVVAVKILLAGLASDPSFQERFRREAKAAGKLNHRNIVAVYDTGEETVSGATVQYIVMEYVEGRTLRDILRAENKLAPERAASIVSDVLAALAYSHRAEIVHRDIKPGNVMVTPNNIVKVMDFGIARALADGGVTMTKTSAVIGTAHYLSPEQARGEKVDGRSDIYSTGCLLYELLTGRPPFVGESPVAVLYQHVREDAAPPSTLEPRIPPTIDAITLKALRKIPGERYQTAEEMRADIARALSGQALLPSDPRGIAVPMPGDVPTGELDSAGMPPDAGAYPDQGAYDDEPYPQRKRRTWIAIAAAAIVVLGIGGFMFDQLRPDGGGTGTPGGVRETVKNPTPDESGIDTGQFDDGPTTEPTTPETSDDSGPGDDDGSPSPSGTPTPTTPTNSPNPTPTKTTNEPSPTPTDSDEPSPTPSDTGDPDPSPTTTTTAPATPPTETPGTGRGRAGA